VAANSLIKIWGYIDLPTSTGATNTVDIFTYSDQHPTDVNTNGRRIDKGTCPQLTLLANQHIGINLNEFTLVKNEILRVNYIGPFVALVNFPAGVTKNVGFLELFLSNQDSYGQSHTLGFQDDSTRDLFY
jgi:hypothetical protein